MNVQVEHFIGGLQGWMLPVCDMLYFNCFTWSIIHSHDNESGKWVGSGNTGGDHGSHKKRNEEHEKNSKNWLTNTFYQWFPYENITNSEGAMGPWQGLHQCVKCLVYCGLSFDRLYTEATTSVLGHEGVLQ